MIGTLIIGGGAAGLYASSLLPDAVILERNGCCGRKLLLTGGGRCNYTHRGSARELIPHYHGSLPFIRKVLFQHQSDDIIRRFRALGIEPVDENGKIFPRGGDAEDILRALEAHQPETVKGKAESIIRDGDAFIVRTENSELRCRRIILAAGGSAYPHTGSDGSGCRLASSLGHTITPLRPALAALSISPSLSAAEGITVPMTLRKGRRSVSDTAVITRRGISGPAAENFSYILSGREEITISFCSPDFRALRAESGAMLVKNALPAPPRLASALLGDIAEKKTANISKSEEQEAFRKLSEGRFMASPIAASAMSSAGGVSTDEINPGTMESKLVPGLYFAGDIIDVDADCGGYSLTWAFATAWIAASHISGAHPSRL